MVVPVHTDGDEGARSDGHGEHRAGRVRGDAPALPARGLGPAPDRRRAVIGIAARADGDHRAGPGGDAPDATPAKDSRSAVSVPCQAVVRAPHGRGRPGVERVIAVAAGDEPVVERGHRGHRARRVRHHQVGLPRRLRPGSAVGGPCRRSAAIEADDDCPGAVRRLRDRRGARRATEPRHRDPVRSIGRGQRDRLGWWLFDADGDQPAGRRSHPEELADRRRVAGRAAVPGLQGRSDGHDRRLREVDRQPGSAGRRGRGGGRR